MAWGKESFDELRSLNSILKNLEMLSAQTLHEVSKDEELKFWDKAFVAIAQGLISNEGANSTLRPDWIAEVSSIVADSLSERRSARIKELYIQKEDNEISVQVPRL